MSSLYRKQARKYDIFPKNQKCGTVNNMLNIVMI